MHIDRAERRNCQKIIRQDSPVSNHNNKIGLQALQDGQCSTVPHFFRLKNRDFVFKGKRLDRREGNLHPAASRFIRLCENTGYIIAVFKQCIQ